MQLSELLIQSCSLYGPQCSRVYFGLIEEAKYVQFHRAYILTQSSSLHWVQLIDLVHCAQLRSIYEVCSFILVLNLILLPTIFI